MITWKDSDLPGMTESWGRGEDGRTRIRLAGNPGRWVAWLYAPGVSVPMTRLIRRPSLAGAQQEAAGEYAKLLRWL